MIFLMFSFLYWMIYIFSDVKKFFIVFKIIFVNVKIAVCLDFENREDFVVV